MFICMIGLFTDPLFPLQSPSSARDLKKKNYGEFIDHQTREVWVVLALVNVFEKSEKKNKTTSVWRLSSDIC